MAASLFLDGWHLAANVTRPGWHYAKAIYQRFWDYRYRRVQRPQEAESKTTRSFHSAAREPFYVCIALVSAVFLINLSVAIWAGVAHGIEDGLVVTLYRGTCSTSRLANLWVHLAINIFASTLFAASTYVMQRLAAPTRRDLDAAHQDGDSLRIGSLAVTNFAILNTKRLVAFLLLWCSSLPLHLMYNGMIEQTTATSEWPAYGLVIQESAIPPSEANITMFSALERTQPGLPGHVGGQDGDDEAENTNLEDLAKLLVNQKPPLERLEISECFKGYSRGSSQTMSDALMVVVDTQLLLEGTGTFPAILAKWPEAYDSTSEYYSNRELHGPGCATKGVMAVALTRLPRVVAGFGMDFTVLFELIIVRTLPPSCELNMSLGMMIAVLICNVGKLVAMLLGLHICTEKPLITIGDAITSFLEEEDHTTKGLAAADNKFYPNFWAAIWNDEELQSKRAIHVTSLEAADAEKASGVADSTARSEASMPAGRWSYHEVSSRVKRQARDQDAWFKRASRTHTVGREIRAAYYSANIIGISCLAISAGLFGSMVRKTKGIEIQSGESFTFSTIWQGGFGMQPRFLSYIKDNFMDYSAAYSASSAYISGAVLANTPQLLLSILYLFYNNFFTRLFMAFEFTSYHTHRRGLRVSCPTPNSAQRGSYFLQFPLRFSLVLIAYFAVTHTLLSESLFLRRAYAIYPIGFTDGNDIGSSLVSRIGFSLFSAFLLTCSLAMLVGLTIGLGFWRRDWILPVTNGDSRSISALCHPPEGQVDLQLDEVRWGVTGLKKIEGKLVGHCSFSSLPVRTPEVGETFW